MHYICINKRTEISQNDEEIAIDNAEPENICDSNKKPCTKLRILKIIFVIICITCPIIFIIIFVILPVIFMNSLYLQQILVFTHFNLPNSRSFFQNYSIPGVKNQYVAVKDLDGHTNVSLGVWHLLPVELTYKSLKDPVFSFDAALKSSNYSVLLYFHGTGESRVDSIRKYELLRHYFHIITFDYRSYADSSKANLSEDAVVNDCVQFYLWLLLKTDSPIFVWSHSLGTALATRVLSILQKQNISPKGLILEAAFTSFSDELRVHPYGKIFSWLPWFQVTILDPLEKNGFVFNTAENILNVTCPIMMLHADDDPIVPIALGEKLFNIILNRKNIPRNYVEFYEFGSNLELKHNFIYQDLFLQYYLRDFVRACTSTLIH